MNILTMVMILLMVLSLMTYAKLETFKSTQIIDQFFNHYMEIEERGFITEHAVDKYKTTKMSPKQSGRTKTKAPGLPRLSLALLLDKKASEEKPDQWKQMSALFKNLTDSLYKDHPFYKEALTDNPTAIDEILTQLSKQIGKIDKDKKQIPKHAADLANIKLNDEKLDLLLYKMLLGAPYKDILKNGPNTNEGKDRGEADNDEEEEVLNEQAEEFNSPVGYYSLLDFVTLAKSEKVRIFLAPREMLTAIFHDPGVVDEIIAQRQELYKLALDAKDAKAIEGLSASFQGQFDHRRDTTIDSSRLDYTVNKTNPKDYEKSTTAK